MFWLIQGKLINDGIQLFFRQFDIAADGRHHADRSVRIVAHNYKNLKAFL